MPHSHSNSPEKSPITSAPSFMSSFHNPPSAVSVALCTWVSGHPPEHAQSTKDKFPKGN